MITTPIWDFASEYADSSSVRMHMPGHKGKTFLGMEALDLTEFAGADELYEPHGIIAQSEENASNLFGCQTCYSTEGSSLCIRAMLYLAVAGRSGRQRILAGRNAHKVFMYSAAMLDFDIQWLYPNSDYHSCPITATEVEEAILQYHPCAVYLTNPDYLGNMVDIAAIANVCHRYEVLLLVDNAHGAYLKFLEPSMHPIDLGADMCCDSAHKTLPVLTGGAYLHSSEVRDLKSAMALFASTSPSYLILESLDLCNRYLETEAKRLKDFLPLVKTYRQKIEKLGIPTMGDEPMKLTICASMIGYSGKELAGCLAKEGIQSEFFDPDYLVLMPTPETTKDDFDRVLNVLSKINVKENVRTEKVQLCHAKAVMSPREAVFAPREKVSREKALGRILADASIGCPPAIPVVICGERMDKKAIDLLAYYDIEEINVVIEY